jgi:hypothetical protein
MTRVLTPQDERGRPTTYKGCGVGGGGGGGQGVRARIQRPSGARGHRCGSGASTRARRTSQARQGAGPPRYRRTRQEQSETPEATIRNAGSRSTTRSGAGVHDRVAAARVAQDDRTARRGDDRQDATGKTSCRRRSTRRQDERTVRCDVGRPVRAVARGSGRVARGARSARQRVSCGQDDRPRRARRVGGSGSASGPPETGSPSCSSSAVRSGGDEAELERFEGATSSTRTSEPDMTSDPDRARRLASDTRP